MAGELILTCDAGTTSSKMSVFDKSGTALCSVRKNYPTEYPKPNWSEQNPRVIMKAIVEGVRELLTQVNPADIACVGLSGTMNGCIAVDGNGRVLYPNIIHSDSRAHREAGEIARVINPEDFYRLTGNRLDHHFTLPKILWIRNNLPEVYEKTRWWLNTKDYMYACLTGSVGVTDYSDASLTTAMDIRARKWSDEMLSSLSLDPSRMPEIRKGHDVSGVVTKEMAHLTGLLAGTPVAVGGGDGACASRGAGLFEPGSAYCNIGSSAWVSQLTKEPLLDKGMRIFNFLDMSGDYFYPCGTIQTGAAAYDWAIDNLLGSVDEKEPVAADYSRIENMARQIAPGAEGVLFMPTLMGERTPYWDANTRGCLIGFTLYHDRRHIARAVYEGVVMALNNVVMIMRECNAPARSMMLTGGGARSGLWPDIFASVFGLETQVHQMPGEATSLGAAITAGVGVGLFDSYEQGCRVARARSRHAVNPAWEEQYRRVWQVYSQIYDRMKPVFDGIAEDFGA